MNRWWRPRTDAPAGEAYRGEAPPWRAAERPPDDVNTVDLFFGWLNERYGLTLARRTAYAERTPLWVLWGIGITFVDPREPDELYRATLDETWKSTDGIYLTLTVVVTGSGTDAGGSGPTPRFVATGPITPGEIA